MQKTKNTNHDLQGILAAMKLAHKAYDKGEVPIGAVLVDPEGAIIARGYNQVEQKNTQLAHAEMQVIAKATKKMGDWRLSDCTLYVTLEPCVMCMGALILSRVGRIVFAAKSPLFGYDLDKRGWFGIYKNSLPETVLYEYSEAAELLHKFFMKNRRVNNANKKTARKYKKRAIGKKSVS